MKKAWYTLAASLVLILVFYFAAPHFFNGHCRTVQGKVSSVYGSTRESIYLKIAGLRYQFKLGTHGSKQFKLNELKKSIVGQDVKISYRERWTPLNPSADKPIAALSIGEQLLYSESDQNEAY